MKIVASTPNLTAKQVYLLTMNPKTVKMKDVVDQRIEISYWARYEDVSQKTGENQQILAIATPEGECFATNSPTFIRDFDNMLSLFESMGETVPAIVVVSGKSKTDREFITCVYSD